MRTRKARVVNVQDSDRHCATPKQGHPFAGARFARIKIRSKPSGQQRLVAGIKLFSRSPHTLYRGERDNTIRYRACPIVGDTPH